MKYEISYITNTGLKREHNEDSILVGDLLISSQSMDSVEKIVLDEEMFFCVVADGMGGHAKGEVASQFVLERLKSRKNEMHDAERIKDILFSINEEMIAFAEENSQYFNMGTVFSGVFIGKEKAIIFSIGDCRVYENALGYANQLSRDHSLVYALYEAGELTYEDMRTHKKKHIVTSAFIANKNQKAHDIYIKEMDTDIVKNGLLLCSDGVWESLRIEEIEHAFSCDDTVEWLKLQVLQTEAKDNFSLIYIQRINNE